MTPREKVELKPCPFCGGPAERVTIMSRVGVRCADALCAGSHRLPTEGEDSADLWNRRTALAPGSGDPISLQKVQTNAGDPDLQKMQFGSGDHAELARLAEAATPGPWSCVEGSTAYPECDDRDFWAAILSPAGKEVVTLHERSVLDDRRDYDFDAAFISAANPATVLALLAEIAALRGDVKVARADLDHLEAHFRQRDFEAAEAERKLAEARGWIKKLDCECDPAWSTRQCGRCTFLSSTEAERG
ncbi:hypothetical protein QOZ96_001085 [Brevundimonas nasdae]|uniref:Lar family restriction alleviation protein n=1 Tax=Brevundimonas nasdae TaxID=172043 RepID=UPI0019126392|nr:Lar family restriction alleviation protein [Brevundimonas nasdae]MBK6024495.1 Lar family restriction alleviation protein [Brevundimonas nasdae]MDQ0451154.1 hypothetical protein [Brevundimonas nasdae]